MYKAECVPVTADSVQEAIDWMWALNRTDPVAPTSTCEALMKAVTDRHVRYTTVILAKLSSCEMQCV